MFGYRFVGSTELGGRNTLTLTPILTTLTLILTLRSSIVNNTGIAVLRPPSSIEADFSYFIDFSVGFLEMFRHCGIFYL